jgi:hypothetical protein
MTLTRLRYIFYANNPLELSPQIARFINRVNNIQINQLNVYANGQNVHDSNIQLCIKDSINALTTRSGIGSYNKIQLIETIMSDSVLTCEEQLIEYLEVECTICLNELKNPIMLKCGHAFCTSCISL